MADWQLKNYDKQCILNFDKAYTIKETPAGGILIWLRKDDPELGFTDVEDEKKALEEHLRKCEIKNNGGVG